MKLKCIDNISSLKEVMNELVIGEIYDGVPDPNPMFAEDFVIINEVYNLRSHFEEIKSDV